MRTVDTYTLGAFVQALAQLEHPLDAQTQAALNQISKTLVENETDAVKQLFEITQQYPPLQSLYQDAYSQIQSNHHIQERHKFIPFAAAPNGNDLSVEEKPEVLQLLNASQRILSASESVGLAKQVQRLTKAYEYALSIFNKPETAWNWLNRPNRALHGVIPADLMSSDVEAEQVHTLLVHIDYGVYS